MAVLLVGLLIPIPIRGLIEIAILIAGLIASFTELERGRPLQVARIGFLALTAIYLLLLLSPNLPDLRIGLEGVRYSLVALSGLFLGLALADRADLPRMIPAITLLLLAGAAVSLAVHLISPDFEQSLNRSADATTGTLGGQIRMQGLLSGPFHVSMLGAFLSLSGAWCLIRRNLWGVPLLAVGELVLLLARVRTGLLAVALGLIVLALLGWHLRQAGPSAAQRKVGPARGLLPILAIPLLILGVGFGSAHVEGHGSADLFTESGATTDSGNAAISELGTLAGGHRTESRLKFMRRAFDTTVDSPIIGRGPGAAASGLTKNFHRAGKVHEQPHNGPLGIAVESGIPGLIAFLMIVGSFAVNLCRELWRRRHPERAGIAFAAAFSLGFFFLTGDALSALPISLCLALITGIYLAASTNDENAVSTDGI